MKIKDGVDLSKDTQEIKLADEIVEDVYDDYGYECWITSGCEGKHRKTSLHYSGYAHDYRTFHIKVGDLLNMYNAISEGLGDDYDVVLEEDHFHVEYDPEDK
jgi:hypothetical protein